MKTAIFSTAALSLLTLAAAQPRGEFFLFSFFFFFFFYSTNR